MRRVFGFESRIGGGCLDNVRLTERLGDALQKRLRGFDSRSALSADTPGRSVVRASRVGYPVREGTVKAEDKTQHKRQNDGLNLLSGHERWAPGHDLDNSCRR